MANLHKIFQKKTFFSDSKRLNEILIEQGANNQEPQETKEEIEIKEHKEEAIFTNESTESETITPLVIDPPSDIPVGKKKRIKKNKKKLSKKTSENILTKKGEK